MTDDGTQEAGGGAGEVVAALRQAAELLRSVGREHPRGPWRWADPDSTGPIGDARPESGSRHGAAQGLDPREAPGSAAWQADPAADPLTTFEHLIPGRTPAGPAPTSARHLHPAMVEPSLAGPLADLLDAVADAAADSPRASATIEPYRAAMRVARWVQAAAREASRS